MCRMEAVVGRCGFVREQRLTANGAQTMISTQEG
jgi:hypothetical protein